MAAVPDFVVYQVGIVYASVCARKDMPIEEVTKRLNGNVIASIGGLWSKSKNKTFSGGESNPCPCDMYPKTHMHYLFSC